MVASELEEHLDVLAADGSLTGERQPRSRVHAEGLRHRAVHLWIYAERSGELLLQKRADHKDSWPGQWDVSSAGHVSAGDTSIASARRELEEELGVALPAEALELLFVYFQHSIINEGTYINNEFNDVYLVTTLECIPLEAFELQESEVSAVKYMKWQEYKEALQRDDPHYVPYEVEGDYGRLFHIIKERREHSLRMKLSRYVPVTLTADTRHVSSGDLLSLQYIIRAAQSIERVFLEQDCAVSSKLRLWLEDSAASCDASELDHLKLQYFLINKSPWSVLDESAPFMSTADAPPVLLPTAVKKVDGWEGLQLQEFQTWVDTLSEEEREAATGFFSVIRRPEDPAVKDSPQPASKLQSMTGDRDLRTITYAKEYENFLTDVAGMLDLAGDDAQVDVTIGPYETYNDRLLGHKATFEAFIGIRDDEATAKVRLFVQHLQELENHLPMDDKYKQKDVGGAAPIRVIQLLYSSGDVRGPHTVAFNLPNDEEIVRERGTAMVMLQNILQAKYDNILQPIGNALVGAEQREEVTFEAYFTHVLCHECCHAIGPHNIVLPDGRASTVRKELQELHSSIEEAKADIVGLWALQYLVDKGFLPQHLETGMYVAFLAGCFRSTRFGLEEAHGRGQALQFNWLIEHGAFKEREDGTFLVDHIRQAVEGLCTEILTLQAQGDKGGARDMLSTYAYMSPPLQKAIHHLGLIEVPVDIAPSFAQAVDLLKGPA
eukprot:SM000103S09515  [mRNA]  locus=s103:477116:482791:+ [translate_table: standard]